jgi:hypothetical protein
VLKYSVDVNRREADRVGKLSLGDRQVADMVPWSSGLRLQCI